jgi:hypothetical protein
LQRLTQLKSERLAEIIQGLLKKLEQVCDLCRFSHYEKRSETSKFKFNPVCEQTIEAIELEVSKLESRYQELDPIFQLIEQRNQMLIEEEEYQKNLNDPDRFKKRFFLLQEEKMRKNIQRLPKITEKLIHLISKYEETNQTSLILNGTRVIEEMSNYMENAEQRKQNKNRPKISGSVEGNAMNGAKRVATPMKSLRDINGPSRVPRR